MPYITFLANVENSNFASIGSRKYARLAFAQIAFRSHFSMSRVNEFVVEKNWQIHDANRIP